MTLEFLLRCHLRGEEGALGMVRLTLDRMAAGGIFDQLGGGFHRYSTDGRWLVPHFEKMLYDNALLVRLYTHAWQLTGEDRYRVVARRTADYLLRELRHGDGGFFSSQDADSEGVEGRFFVWSFDELAGIAGEPVARHLGATPEGNWEGTNVLWTPRPAPEGLEAELAAALPRLFEAREARVHPATDDKVLAAWNGLAISALAEAGRSFGEPRFLDAALAAAGFVLEALAGDGGRLLRSWRDGRKGGPGYLDDYACMAEACLTLYETTFELRWLREARRLAGDMVELFADPGGDGFYQTGRDAEQLVVRPRELFDNAVPAGSSVAAELLQRLGRLTGDQDTERAGRDAPAARPRGARPGPDRLRARARGGRLRAGQGQGGGHRRPPGRRRHQRPAGPGLGHLPAQPGAGGGRPRRHRGHRRGAAAGRPAGPRGPRHRLCLRALRLPAAGHRAGRAGRPARLNAAGKAVWRPPGQVTQRRQAQSRPRLPAEAREAALSVPIDRRSVTRELRLLLQSVDGLAGEGLAAALQRVAEAAHRGPAGPGRRGDAGRRARGAPLRRRQRTARPRAGHRPGAAGRRAGARLLRQRAAGRLPRPDQRRALARPAPPGRPGRRPGGAVGAP